MKIKLSVPIISLESGEIREIELREPKYMDFMDLGAPSVWVAIDGGGYEQETPSITRAWIERLVNIDPNLLAMLNLADTLELRNSVMRFFREARETRMHMTLSTNSHEASSSASHGQPGPSKL